MKIFIELQIEEADLLEAIANIPPTFTAVNSKDPERCVVRIALALKEAYARRRLIPNVEMQNLIDAGFNAFGLQLFAESVAGKADALTFNPFSFKFRNIKVTLEPAGEVDTRRH